MFFINGVNVIPEILTITVIIGVAILMGKACWVLVKHAKTYHAEEDKLTQDMLKQNEYIVNRKRILQSYCNKRR